MRKYGSLCIGYLRRKICTLHLICAQNSQEGIECTKARQQLRACGANIYTVTTLLGLAQVPRASMIMVDQVEFTGLFQSISIHGCWMFFSSRHQKLKCKIEYQVPKFPNQTSLIRNFKWIHIFFVYQVRVGSFYGVSFLTGYPNYQKTQKFPLFFPVYQI